MASVRSRNYPSVDLGAALVMARKAYAKDGRNKMSRQALAKHIGHESLSGPALSKIGLLRAYGLVVGSVDDLRITDDAETAMEAPEGSPERVDALRRLAFGPNLFQEIQKEYPTPPSEDNLRFWLLKRKLTSEAATKASKAYLTTIRLVGESGGAYIPSLDEEGEDMETAQDSASTGRSSAARKPPTGSRQAVFPLSDGDVTLVFPADLSASGYEELDDYLQIFLRKAKRDHTRKAQETFNKADDDLDDLQ